MIITVRSHEGKRVNLNEISDEINSPITFTAKVLQQSGDLFYKNYFINCSASVDPSKAIVED